MIENKISKAIQHYGWQDKESELPAEGNGYLYICTNADSRSSTRLPVVIKTSFILFFTEKNVGSRFLPY